MTVSILTGFEKVHEIIMSCIQLETESGGLLEDVESVVNTYYDDGSHEEPIIWIAQHPTTANRQADISQTLELTTPFEFDCGVYEDDIEESNLSSQNLANRVILSVLKNWQTAQAEVMPGQRMIKNITLQTYSPVGYVPVKGKSDRVAVTGVILNVNHIVNWKMCCKQLQSNNEE